jgi:hypothetical protein
MSIYRKSHEFFFDPVTDFESEQKEYITLDSNYAKLYKKCRKYISDPKYVFKSCYNKTNKNPFPERKWIVVLEKINTTITNENRKNVIDKRFAKFRANELKVIKIINMIKPNFVQNKIKSIYETETTIYKVGKIVKSNGYDNNEDKICSRGIHYFRTLFRAYFYGDSRTKKIYSWYDNGDIFKIQINALSV